MTGISIPPSIIRNPLRRAMRRGFTLVELVIAVALIGILLAFAMPGYNQYLIRANKAAAKAVILEVFSRQEQYMMNSGTYGTLAQLNYTVPTDVSTYFDVTLTTGTNTTSSIVALQGMPIFLLCISGKAGTIQANEPAGTSCPGTAYSVNQFGLKLPVAAW